MVVKVSAVTVSPYTANRIYLATDQGKVYRVNSANGSSPSISTISTSSLPSGYINCIAVGSSDNQLMVTYTSYGVTSVWETKKRRFFLAKQRRELTRYAYSLGIV